MRVSQLQTTDQVLAEQLQDQEFRAEWERTALARAVAIAVVTYRAEHQLSQRGLAERLGWKQPAVARLELGEHTPSFSTLCELSQKLGIEFVVSITPPAAATNPWFAPQPEDAAVLEDTQFMDGTRVAVVARTPAALNSRARRARTPLRKGRGPRALRGTPGAL